MGDVIHEASAYDREEMFRVLASRNRLDILELLAERELNINEIARELELGLPSVSKHVALLEQAGLVKSSYVPGVQGMQKRCRLAYQRLAFSLEPRKPIPETVEEISMPIGLYTQVECLGPPCGLASKEGYIGLMDDPQAFYCPDRADASILWMSAGFVEYVFPNTIPTSVDIWRVDLQMEVCSECPDYCNDHPSDITVWVNGVEIGTWTCPGDFGGRRGVLNPPWWNNHGTQFGALKVFSVTETGSQVDGVPISPVTVALAGVVPQRPVRVRIGVKPDAANRGGFNLFGRHFGNYAQDLVLRLHYVPKDRVRRIPRPAEEALGHNPRPAPAGAGVFEEENP